MCRHRFHFLLFRLLISMLLRLATFLLALRFSSGIKGKPTLAPLGLEVDPFRGTVLTLRLQIQWGAGLIKGSGVWGLSAVWGRILTINLKPIANRYGLNTHFHKISLCLTSTFSVWQVHGDTFDLGSSLVTYLRNTDIKTTLALQQANLRKNRKSPLHVLCQLSALARSVT